MSRSLDWLLDLFREPQWQSWPSVTTAWTKIVNATEEMLIEPDTPNGPMLRVQTKDSDGNVCGYRSYNLPALDEHIGKLIAMRDKLAKLKE